jgi:type II restriction/modification system DNA methylase subunit YeeA
LANIYTQWQRKNRATIAEMQNLEQENNRLFIDAYGLQDELTPDVPLEQITLTVNPKYRYGGKLSEEALENRFQSDTLAELISYATGCMMGRYRLDKAGLIYAHAGNKDFTAIYDAQAEPVDMFNIQGWVSDSETQQIEATNDGLRDKTANPSDAENPFLPDDDGIIPLTDQEWFADDATLRFAEFVRAAWGEENQQQNLDFIAESLGLYAIKPKNSETSLDAIRRYLSTQFYKDHLKTYKKRPIYWLFSSGKQKAFECIVYLHRYNESTLSCMRIEYVTQLLGKYESSGMVLQKQIEEASSTAEANRHKKALTALEKKQTELSEFDDKLKHAADMRISLDLDDGVMWIHYLGHKN